MVSLLLKHVHKTEKNHFAYFGVVTPVLMFFVTLY